MQSYLKAALMRIQLDRKVSICSELGNCCLSAEVWNSLTDLWFADWYSELDKTSTSIVVQDTEPQVNASY